MEQAPASRTATSFARTAGQLKPSD